MYNCYFNSLEFRFKKNENIINSIYFENLLSSLNNLFCSYQNELFSTEFNKKFEIIYIAMSCYDDVFKIVDNIILDNHNVCYSILRVVIENLILIKLLRYCDEETFDIFHYVEIWRKENKDFPNDNQVLESLKTKYGLDFKNSSNAYNWSVKEVMKLDNFNKDENINLNHIINCLTKIYRDSDAKKIYRMYNSLSKSSHAVSHKRTEIFLSESSPQLNINHIKKICEKTIKIIELIINEVIITKQTIKQ